MATKKTATKKAKKEITNLIVVDASGSMSSKREEVIGGLKQIFGQIKTDAKKDKAKVNVRTIVLDFSGPGDLNVLVDSTDSSELKDDLANAYRTRGMTALFDAISRGFGMLKKKIDGCFINILTDGAENSSQEATSDTVKTLIADAKKKGWAVTFMGTTEDSINQAKNLGVTAGNTMMFANTGAGVTHSMNVSSAARKVYYKAAVGGQSLTTDGLENLLAEAEKTGDNPKKDLLKQKKNTKN